MNLRLNIQFLTMHITTQKCVQSSCFTTFLLINVVILALLQQEIRCMHRSPAAVRLNRQILDTCAVHPPYITNKHTTGERGHTPRLPSETSWVWWWSSAQSSWEESTESASCLPQSTDCSKAPSDYPGCICACNPLPVHWKKRWTLGHVCFSHYSADDRRK